MAIDAFLLKASCLQHFPIDGNFLLTDKFISIHGTFLRAGLRGLAHNCAFDIRHPIQCGTYAIAKPVKLSCQMTGFSGKARFNGGAMFFQSTEALKCLCCVCFLHLTQLLHQTIVLLKSSGSILHSIFETELDLQYSCFKF